MARATVIDHCHLRVPGYDPGPRGHADRVLSPMQVGHAAQAKGHYMYTLYVYIMDDTVQATSNRMHPSPATGDAAHTPRDWVN